jgi:hypothetical protein
MVLTITNGVNAGRPIRNDFSYRLLMTVIGFTL